MIEGSRQACVIGAGSWASALALVLSDNGYRVRLWARNPQVLEHFSATKCLPKLPGISLPPAISVTTDYREALHGSALIVIAVPSSAVASVAQDIAIDFPDESSVVTATKGFDYRTLRRPSEVWSDANEGLKDRISVLSGPNFATEVARRLPTATVVAAKEKATRLFVQHAFMTHNFRVYTHTDVAGVEIGGALKNIIALACGMAEGMNIGYNAQAAIISRGIAEIARLGVCLGAEPLTFSGLSGLGDLVLTSTGHLSRNRQAGIAVGQGQPVNDFLGRTGYTVEGLETVKTARRLSLIHDVQMPITDMVYEILYNGVSVSEGLSKIMSRERKPESEPYFQPQKN